MSVQSTILVEPFTKSGKVQNIEVSICVSLTLEQYEKICSVAHESGLNFTESMMATAAQSVDDTVNFILDSDVETNYSTLRNGLDLEGPREGFDQNCAAKQWEKTHGSIVFENPFDKTPLEALGYEPKDIQ